MRAMRMGGTSRGTVRADVVSSIDQSLRVSVFDPGIMVCLQFRLSVLICLLCFFEDVDQVFSSTDDFPRLVNYRDRFSGPASEMY